MFKIDRDTVYSLDEARELLHGLVELDTLMERGGLKDGRKFRDALLGEELIEAWKRAKAYTQLTQSAAVLPIGRSSGPGGRGGRVSGLQRFSVKRIKKPENI